MNDTETDKHKRGREVTIKKDRSSELVFLVRKRDIEVDKYSQR